MGARGNHGGTVERADAACGWRSMGSAWLFNRKLLHGFSTDGLAAARTRCFKPMALNVAAWPAYADMLVDAGVSGVSFAVRLAKGILTIDERIAITDACCRGQPTISVVVSGHNCQPTRILQRDIRHSLPPRRALRIISRSQ
jgi:hypothetical protein